MEKDKILPGERVAAIAHMDAEKVVFYGYGVYEGDFISPFSVDVTDSPEKPDTNPRIRLDNGKIVWGIECWWLKEEDFRSVTPPDRIEIADIDTDRQKRNSLLQENN